MFLYHTYLFESFLFGKKPITTILKTSRINKGHFHKNVLGYLFFYVIK